MCADPLPSVLDVRKVAARGATVKGSVSPGELLRFRSLLADDVGEINVEMRFQRDEEGRYVVELLAQCEVTVICQRCLKPKIESLSCHTALAIVWTDEEAVALPRHLEPLIVPEQSCELREVVEDELILALPQFSYHDTPECKKIIEEFSDAPEELDAEKPNPFEVLAQLKPSKD